MFPRCLAPAGSSLAGNGRVLHPIVAFGNILAKEMSFVKFFILKSSSFLTEISLSAMILKIHTLQRG